jgi:hypothetical protein
MKKVKELLKAKQDIPTKLLDPILDPKAIWKARQEEIKIQEALQQEQEEEEEEVTIVVDTTSNQSLQPQEKDFIPFPTIDSDNDDSNTSGSRSGSNELGLYNSDNDYSWYRRYRGG